MKRWILCSMLCGCGAPAASAEVARPTPSASASPAEAATTAAPQPAPAPTREALAPAPPAARPKTPFPPPPLSPPFARTAQGSDGVWRALPEGTAPERAAMFVTTIHPSPLKKQVYVMIVAIDATRTRLGLVAGTEEPESERVGKEQRTGLIPPPDRAGTLAVWNGGFKAHHGGYGFVAGGLEYLPPLPDACTIVLGRDARVRVGTWSRMKVEAGEVLALRQTPPCLVEGGELNPELPREKRVRDWGAAENGDREIRRSALALDASRDVVMYAFGDWILAAELAATLKAAGAQDAAELDVNWSYPRFFWTGQRDGATRLAGTFVPKITWSADRYFAKASERDFFYLVTR